MKSVKVHGRRSKSMAVPDSGSSSPPMASSKPPPLAKRMSLLTIGRKSSMSSLISSSSLADDPTRVAVYRFLDLCCAHDQDSTHHSQVILELMKEAKERGEDPMLAQYREWIMARGDRYFCKLCMAHRNDVPRNVTLAHQGYELKDKQPFYAILKNHTKNKQHQEYLEKLRAKKPKPTSSSIPDLASMKHSKALVGVKAHLKEYPWLVLDHNLWICRLCKKLDDKALAALSKRDFFFAVKGFDPSLKEELPHDILMGEDWQLEYEGLENGDSDESETEEICDDLFEESFAVPDLDQKHSCLSVVCNVLEADGVFTKSEIQRGAMSCVKVRYANEEKVTGCSGGSPMPKYGSEFCFLAPCDKVLLEATIWKESLDTLGSRQPICNVLVGGVAIPICRLEPNKWTEQWYHIHGKTHLKLSIHVSVKPAAVPGLGYYLRIEDVDSRIDKLKIPPVDIIEATREFGLDGPYFNHLLWISKTYLTCDLPKPWKRLYDSKGSVYYFNSLTMESTKQSPLFPYYYELAQRKKSQTEFRGFKISGEPYNYDSKYDVKVISNRTKAHRKSVNERQATEALVQKTLYRQAAAIRALPKYYIDKDQISRKKRRDEDISSGRIPPPKPKEDNHPESSLRSNNVDPLLNDPEDDPLEELREEKEYKEMYQAEDLRSHRAFVRVARKRIDVAAPPKGFLASRHISKSCRKSIDLQLKIDYNRRMAKAFYDCYQEMTQPVDMDFTLDYDWPAMHANPHAYSASGPMPAKDTSKSSTVEEGEPIHMQSLNRRRALVDTTENRLALESLKHSVGEVLEEKRYMDNYVKYLKGDLKLQEKQEEVPVIDTKEEAMGAFLMGIFGKASSKTPVASAEPEANIQQGILDESIHDDV